MEKRSAISDDTMWPTTTMEPSARPRIVVVFHGLFAFAYNRGKKVCEIGTHSKAADHEFGVHVIEFEGETPKRLVYSFVPESHSDVRNPITLNVRNPTSPNVYFFELEGDFRAWHRVPDLEGPKFHNRELKNKKYLKPRIKIDSGLFFVGATTSPFTFKRVADDNSDEPIPLHEIAYVPAVELSPSADGLVVLNVEGQNTFLYPPSDGRTLVIFFRNVCPAGVCDWQKSSTAKKERNDFYLFYKTFDKPSDQPEYMLVVSDETQKTEPTFLKFIEVLYRFSPMSSKDSPCGGIGFGQSNGLG